MSSDKWSRCPNCSRNTRQDPIGDSGGVTYAPPLYGKPKLTITLFKKCWHCKTEYSVHYNLKFLDRVILKKGEDGWL